MTATRVAVRSGRRALAVLGRTLLALSRALDVIAGIGSYERYVAHLRATHPDRAVPTRAEFFRERQAARYARGGRSPCC